MFIRTDERTLINVAAISTIRLSRSHETENPGVRDGHAPVGVGVAIVAHITMINGEKFEIEGQDAVNNLIEALPG